MHRLIEKAVDGIYWSAIKVRTRKTTYVWFLKKWD